MIELSIIIPTYNCGSSIIKCLDSIYKSNISNFEIIIIDDGSSDDSREIIANYKTIHGIKNLNYYYKLNGGPGSARNVGLSKIKGKYVGFVDSDDVVDERLFSTLLKTIKTKKTDFCFCGYDIFVNDKINHIIPFKSGSFSNDMVLSWFLSWQVNISLWNSIFKADIICNFGLCFKELYCAEDVDFICNYLINAKKVSIIPDSLYRYNFEKKKSINRELKSITSCFEESIYYPLLCKIENSSLILSKEALVYCRIPLFAISELMKRAAISDNFKSFKNVVKQNEYLKLSFGRVNKNVMPKSIFRKLRILRTILRFSKRLFFIVSKKRYV